MPGLRPAGRPDVGLLVLVFAVPLQALSSIFGLLARDPAASRRRQAEVAMTEEAPAEVSGVEHEAGVRRTL
jgi:hypothetical protein